MRKIFRVNQRQDVKETNKSHRHVKTLAKLKRIVKNGGRGETRSDGVNMPAV